MVGSRLKIPVVYDLLSCCSIKKVNTSAIQCMAGKEFAVAAKDNQQFEF